MWFFLSLLSAFFQVLRNMSMKHLGHALDETINVWGRFTFILPWAAGAVLYRGMPEVANEFWVLAIVFGISQNMATLSLSKALKVSDISLVTALWKISVLILVLWGYLWLGETPSAMGLGGVLISVSGVYLLNVHKARISLLAPLKALVEDPGQRWTILAGIGYGLSVPIIKQMALYSDSFFAVFMGYVFCSVLITPYAIYRSGPHFRQVGRYWKSFVGMGLFSALSTWAGTYAYTLTVSAYVEAVKQVEVLFALAIGYLVFKEGNTVRLVWKGALVIVGGVVLLKLGS